MYLINIPLISDLSFLQNQLYWMFIEQNCKRGGQGMVGQIELSFYKLNPPLYYISQMIKKGLGDVQLAGRVKNPDLQAIPARTPYKGWYGYY
jgi:hypothetical protein